ncbi:MAG: Crp/Fnr family transcriptional regulator [Vampirovibrionales bacterium]|nr:Crp/Fnr family transcriptional regulator [Vampirovibrionales bacterium]
MSATVNPGMLEELSKASLFEGVSADIVQTFLNSGSRFVYGAGTPIIIINDTGETFFLILGGIAKITLLNDKNDAVNVTLFKTGDFFGELSLLEARPTRTANVIAASEVEVLAIQRPQFMKLMHQHPDLALNMAKVLGQRIRAMNDRMLTLTLPDLHRVASTLLHLARQGKTFSEQGPVLLPNLPLKDWVLFCNSSQDKFMEIIEHMRNAGVLEWSNQRIVVKNLSLLSKLSKPDPSHYGE